MKTLIVVVIVAVGLVAQTDPLANLSNSEIKKRVNAAISRLDPLALQWEKNSQDTAARKSINLQVAEISKLRNSIIRGRRLGEGKTETLYNNGNHSALFRRLQKNRYSPEDITKAVLLLKTYADRL